ncbi:MAG TPA: hypothetical protein VHX12_11580 [Acidisoma sp.]|nr:hypothetical protein [Acidisoma sp.]
MARGFDLGRLLWCLSLLLLLLLGSAIWCRSHAQSLEDNVEAPRSAFFGGVGLGINAVNFGHQSLYVGGTSRNYADGALVSAGIAWGSGSVDKATQTTASPELRLGYYRHFGTSPWLWGVKASYTDLLAAAASYNVGVPQGGVIAYASTQGSVPLTGVAVMQSYRVKADSRFGAGPFIGYSLGPGFLYLGLGGTMTHAETDLNDLVGYASVNSQTVTVSGAPQSFASSGWVLGASMTVGGNYFVTKDWFLDIAYSFAETAAQVGHYVSSFTNALANPGLTATGNRYGQSSEKIVTDSVTLTINRGF